MAIFVRELVRPTYACRSCESQGHDPQIAKAALPPEPIPKSGVGAGLLAHVIVSKFVRPPAAAPPGVDPGPPRLGRAAFDPLRPPAEVRPTADAALRPDAPTPAAVVRDPRRRHAAGAPAAAADRLRLGLPRRRRRIPYTLFDLTAGRSQTFPQAFLAGYRGFVHADAYDGYNAVHDNVRHLGCWMHARRYFVEAEPSDPRAVEALAFIRTLYAVEREIKDERERLGDRFTDADVVRLRRTRAGPILATVRRLARRAASPRDAEKPVRSGHRVFPESVGFARSLPRRRAVRDRQRGRRAGHPSPGRRPGQLAAHWRRRRVEDRLRAAERLRQRDAAPPQPVVVSPRRARSTRRPLRRRRRGRSPPRCLGHPSRPNMLTPCYSLCGASHSEMAWPVRAHLAVCGPH